MKRSVLLPGLIFLFPALMLGHSPKKVSASYNEKTKKITIEAIHPVKDVKKHYIESIVIFQGDKEIKTINLTEQSEKAKEVYEIELPGIGKGSEVTITAKCSVMGSKKVSLKL